MSKNQKIVLLIGGLMIVLRLVFPVVNAYESHNNRLSDTPFDTLQFYPMTKSYPNCYYGCSVQYNTNTISTTFEVFALILATGVLWLVLRNNNRKG